MEDICGRAHPRGVEVLRQLAAIRAQIPQVARYLTAIPGEMAVGILDEDRLQLVRRGLGSRWLPPFTRPLCSDGFRGSSDCFPRNELGQDLHGADFAGAVADLVEQ